jgi:hypothetical protein
MIGLERIETAISVVEGRAGAATDLDPAPESRRLTGGDTLSVYFVTECYK